MNKEAVTSDRKPISDVPTGSEVQGRDEALVARIQNLQREVSLLSDRIASLEPRSALERVAKIHAASRVEVARIKARATVMAATFGNINVGGDVYRRVLADIDVE